MSEIRFTKGPWKMDERGEDLVGEKGKTVGVWGCGLSGVNKAEESVANSKLIAAAPEMYEMLERLFDTGGLVYLDDYDKVPDLLAKARGEL